MFLIALIGAFIPRVVLIFMWLLDYTRFNVAYETFIWPFLGIIFMPYTTLMYVFVYDPIYGLSFFGWMFMFLAVLIDLGAYFGSYAGRTSSTTAEVVAEE